MSLSLGRGVARRDSDVCVARIVLRDWMSKIVPAQNAGFAADVPRAPRLL
jgi:hypothetical protein